MNVLGVSSRASLESTYPRLQIVNQARQTLESVEELGVVEHGP